MLQFTQKFVPQDLWNLLTPFNVEEVNIANGKSEYVYLMNVRDEIYLLDEDVVVEIAGYELAFTAETLQRMKNLIDSGHKIIYQIVNLSHKPGQKFYQLQDVSFGEPPLYDKNRNNHLTLLLNGKYFYLSAQEEKNLLDRASRNLATGEYITNRNGNVFAILDYKGSALYLSQDFIDSIRADKKKVFLIMDHYHSMTGGNDAFIVMWGDFS